MMQTIWNKLKKIINLSFTLAVVACLVILSIEAIKMHDGEDNLIEQFATGVGEWSFTTPPFLSVFFEDKAPDVDEDDSYVAATVEQNGGRTEAGKTSVKASIAANNEKKDEPPKDIATEKETVQEPVDQQQPDQQEVRKIENKDLPPNNIVFYPDLAAENLRILNAERRKRGIPELTVHNELMKIANMKVDDMMIYQYYGHGSPRLGSTTEYVANRMDKGSHIISENLNMIRKPIFWYKELNDSFSEDLAQMAQRTHNSLMKSDGHRENMLDPELVYVGIAAAGGIEEIDGEDYYVFKVVQVFMSEPLWDK